MMPKGVEQVEMPGESLEFLLGEDSNDAERR